jgi:hypothetical protein
MNELFIHPPRIIMFQETISGGSDRCEQSLNEVKTTE